MRLKSLYAREILLVFTLTFYWSAFIARADDGASSVQCINAFDKPVIISNSFHFGKDVALEPLENIEKSTPAAILHDILSEEGMAHSISAYPAPIGTACAAFDYRKKRVIYFDPSWLEKYSGGDYWIKVGILAHEIGHHVNFHSDDDHLNSWQREYQADVFLGRAVRHLHGTLEDALRGVSKQPEDSMDDHPPRTQREAAIKNGYSDPQTAPQKNAQDSSKGKAVSQVTTKSSKSLDVIVVIDDSGSMKADQTKFANNFAEFVEKLNASNIDFRICVTTTDVHYYKGSPIIWGKYSGKKDEKRKDILDPYSVVLDPEADDLPKHVQDTINSLGAEWSSDERGIAAVSLMAENFRNPCFRGSGVLQMIVLSDEDERSVGGIIELSRLQFKKIEEIDKPSNLNIELRQKFKYQNFRWNSVIVVPNDKKCESIQDKENPSFPGTYYFEFAKITAGQVASICDANYESFFSNIYASIEQDFASVASSQ
jgi:hypothetical protein